MGMFLKEYDKYFEQLNAGHFEGAWELLHEDLGFLGPDLLVDLDLIDIDGQETHMMHQMDHPAAKEAQE